MNKYKLIFLGILCGVLIATMFAGKSVGEQGIFHSITFTIGNYKIHLHHWLLSLIALVVLSSINYKVKIFKQHPIFYLVAGAFMGLVLQGIFMYSDWYKIIS